MYIYKCYVPIILVKVIKWILNFLLTLSSGKERGVSFLKKSYFFFFFNSSFLLGPVNGQRYKMFQQTIRHGTSNYPLSLLQLTGQTCLLWITTTGIKIIHTIFIPIYGHTIMYIVYCMMNKMKFIDEYTKYCIHI